MPKRRSPLPRLVLALTTALSSTVSAQAPLPPPPAQPTPGPAAPDADPPARVGRIARLDGTVSFHAPDAAQWVPAARNFPLITGDALWTEPRAGAAVDFGGARLAMAPTTEVGFGPFAADGVTATAGQGELCLQVDPTPEPQRYVVQTPRGLVTVTQPGRYGIAVGDADIATVVTVLAGAAAIGTGPNTVQVSANQAATIAGADPNLDTKVGPARPDPFLQSTCVPPRPAARPAATALMVGAADLDDYGAWQTAPDYGDVWYPRVAAGWVPYRTGHWAYVGPWGWTWVDDEPWGFAPFHYGRWALIGGRWGWVPVDRAVTVAGPPVYAPALVAFVGIGAAVGVGLGLGAHVGWVPLGPREPFVPWYHASPAYVQRVNIRHVENVQNITVNRVNNTTIINNYANRGAATVIPAAAMAASRPVGLVARPLAAPQLAAARPIEGEPLRPSGATQGITPAVAQSLHLPGPAAAPPRPAPAPASIPGAGRFPGPTRPVLPAAEPPRPVEPRAESRIGPQPPGRPVPPNAEPPRSPEPRAEAPRVPAPGPGNPGRLPRAEPPRPPTPQAPRPASPPRPEALRGPVPPPHAAPPRPPEMRPAPPRAPAPRPEAFRAPPPRPQPPPPRPQPSPHPQPHREEEHRR